MYFANDAGLLLYDGSTWKQYPLSNQTVFRSLIINDDGIIYGGGQNEIGKYVPNEIGAWTFQSLTDKIPEEHRGFEDVWETIKLNESIFFRASKKVYEFKNDQFKVYDEVAADFLGIINNEIFIHNKEKGIFKLNNGTYEFLKGTEFLIHKKIIGFITLENNILFATRNNSIYTYTDGICKQWGISTTDFFIDNQIRSISKFSNNKIGVGTIFGGLILLNEKGQTLNHIDKKDGLLGSGILSQFWDKNGNLWLGLDKGINYLHTNSAFTKIIPDKQFEGAGYTSAIFNDQLYLGTNNGLYTTPWKKDYDPITTKGFTLVDGTKGQTWGLDIIDEKLILSKSNGAFNIDGKTSKPLTNNDGYWLFEELSDNKNQIIAGTYRGLSLFEKKGGQWVYQSKVSDLIESSRFIEEDKYGNIWIAHPYKGIYKIESKNMSSQSIVTFLGQDQGLPSNLNNHLFKIKDEIVFCGERGSYSYNYDEGKFEYHVAFNEIFGEYTKIRRLVEAPNGNIWFLNREEFGVLLIDDLGVNKKIEKKVFPELRDLLNGGFELIYPYDDNNVFISTEKGFLHYTPNFKAQLDSNLQIILNEVAITKEDKTALFMGNHFYNNKVHSEYNPKEPVVLPHSSNALSFSFSATSFSHTNLLNYRYKLDGFDKNWSTWSQKNKKEYTNLSHGKYTFLIQAKDYHNVESEIYEFPFSISPPWYLSKWATIFYIVSIVLLAFLIIKSVNKKYQDLEDDHEKIVQKSQEEINQLKSDKIQLELEHKKRALVSSTLLLVQKNETLVELKEHLIQIKKETNDSKSKPKINKLIHLLQQDEILDEGWEQFMLHFNELHGDFLKRLKGSFSELTPKDLKLCGYLRMNLSTKEIASLMNISIRGVEASRYRLRKKCELDSSKNLTEFLMEF